MFFLCEILGGSPNRSLETEGARFFPEDGLPELSVERTTEGQIRRMFEAVGHPVHKLLRIQFGPLADPALKPGAWRFLNQRELMALKSL